MLARILTEGSAPPGAGLPAALAHLPAPSAEALAACDALRARIAKAITEGGGFLDFARYMAMALYEPGLGYYAAGSTKLGPGGDFVTAPEISPLFGRALAAQVAELAALGCRDVLEFGAGSGALAAVLLAELERLGALPQAYAILELSPDLRQRQRALLEARVPALAARVTWLDTLPERLDGVVIGNEVLDAMPVHLVRIAGTMVEEIGVTAGADGRLAWAHRPAQGRLREAAAALDLADGYTTEIHLEAAAFVRTVAGMPGRGAAIFIDYGFPRREYYHPERSRGTLMCHYRHHAHADPLVLPGLQDITTHLDFSTLAEAAVEAGARHLGYTSQAQFLINCGIVSLLEALDPSDATRYLPAAAGVQKLLSPAEMGELFKVLAFGRGIGGPLLGFRAGDRSVRL